MAVAEKDIIPSLQCDSSLPGSRPDRKKLVRRAGRDWSQPLRRLIQGLFLALNILLGLQFILFVHYFESGGRTVHVSRPAGVEGYLPIAGLMNLKYFLLTGKIPAVHPAAMFLLGAFLLISIVFRKAFCSWLCPVGTISELLWKLGRKLFKKNWTMPRSIDFPLRGLKYLVLGLFLYAVALLPANSIEAFLSSPYGIVADVKMLNFFRTLSETAAITIIALVVLSFFYMNFWCRYLCPYGALMGLASLISPSKIRRDPDLCIDCAKCTKACPSLLPVAGLITVRSAECTACLECVAVCPAEDALQLSVPRKRRVPAWVLATGVAFIFLGIVGYAKLAGTWNSNIPDAVYFHLVPVLNQLRHP
ncbi:MAG TPA: 4Fe-4S binding protein [Acidobacteriota bacterium]|nr:4Fe-4S binding protein [Acidobacteriota bacterium]